MGERYFVLGRSGDVDLGCECDTVEQAFAHVARSLAHPSPYDGSRLTLDQFTVVRGEKIELTKARLPKVPRPGKVDRAVVDKLAAGLLGKFPFMTSRISKAARLVDDVSATGVVGSYRVLGSQGRRYTVIFGVEPSCECPDRSENGVPICKHILAVGLYLAATNGGGTSSAPLLRLVSGGKERPA